MLVIQCMLLMYKLFSKKSGVILIDRRAFAFSFSARFFVICCCSKLFGCFFYFLENASTNHTVIFCNFAYFSSSFPLSDCALCLIRLCPIHWAQLDRKIIFLKCARKFFCEFQSVKIHLHMINLFVQII